MITLIRYYELQNMLVYMKPNFRTDAQNKNVGTFRWCPVRRKYSTMFLHIAIFHSLLISTPTIPITLVSFSCKSPLLHHHQNSKTKWGEETDQETNWEQWGDCPKECLKKQWGGNHILPIELYYTSRSAPISTKQKPLWEVSEAFTWQLGTTGYDDKRRNLDISRTWIVIDWFIYQFIRLRLSGLI